MCQFRFALLICAAGLLAAAPSLIAAPAALQSVPLSSDELFRNVELFWSQEVSALGGRYRPPKLKLFGAPISGGCTLQAALSAPYYCPVNETVYLDRSFLQELRRRDPKHDNVAAGIVVAHEVAHHIQNIIGTTGSVDQSRANSTPELAQRIFTAFELQADCYAGLWARWAAAQGTVTVPADVQFVLDAIAATSRDWQAHLTAGQQILDPFSQGTAAQRLKWFHRGLDSGNFDNCDTFGANAAGNL